MDHKQDQLKRDLYKDSGVDTHKGDALVDWLASSASKNSHPYGEVVSGIGGFAALFRPRWQAFSDPLLVTGTDGVGTKVLLGIEQRQVQGLGIDLVAMCANDVITTGARPLFFLDYFASGTITEDDFKNVLTGIREGCAQAECLLVGGETAEMPGLYSKGHFDLAGFVIGIVDAPKVLGASKVKSCDSLIAIHSSGFHSNGYSLIRQWIKEKPEHLRDQALINHLLAPTMIYGKLPALLDTVGESTLHALAHITGGGISGNLPRVLPESLGAIIEWHKIPTPTWMRTFIESHATLTEVEPVFNLGVGMIAVVGQGTEKHFIDQCQTFGMKGTHIGKVSPNHPGKVVYT